MQPKHGSFEVNPPFVPALLTAAAQHVLALLQARGAGPCWRRPPAPASSLGCLRPPTPAAHAPAAAAPAQAAEAAGGALSFAVLMPGWKEVAGWRALTGSSFLRHSLLVAAADHGCGGSCAARLLYPPCPPRPARPALESCLSIAATPPHRCRPDGQRRYCDGSSHQARDLYRKSPYDTALLLLQTTAAAARWRASPALLRELQAAMAACVPTAAAVERQRKRRGAADLEWEGAAAAAPKRAAPPRAPAAT